VYGFRQVEDLAALRSQPDDQWIGRCLDADRATTIGL
jgi:hypothetical protein